MRKPNFQSLLACLLFALCVAPSPNHAETAPGRKAIQITFLPPPLENASYSLGIYEAKTGKLIRHLHEAATEEAFTAGLNGFITRWDGKNDLGELVPAGRYAARGYGVGPLKVEGVEFVGNDWVDADESLRIEHIEALALVPPSADLLVTASLVGGSKTQVRFSAEDGSVISKGLPDSSAPRPQTISAGKDGSSWVVSVGTLYQLPANTSDPAGLITTPEKLALLAMRVLAPSSNEPPIRAVSASASQDKLYVLEQMPGWQRVRGLAWLEAKEEDGRKVSNWETFFERSIRPADPARGLDPAAKSVPSVRFQLAANALSPGKTPSEELTAAVDAAGSYLVTADGLRLRRISEQPHLITAKLAKGSVAGSLTLYQFDGSAWEEFSIAGAREMMSFDAGEIEMTAVGEKPSEPKIAEPPDL